MNRLTCYGTAEPVSRDQILRHARGQGYVYFPCSADHEQDWQLYPVDPYSAICDDHTYHTDNGWSKCLPRWFNFFPSMFSVIFLLHTLSDGVVIQSAIQTEKETLRLRRRKCYVLLIEYLPLALIPDCY